MVDREEIINYIKENYDADPEYLWDDLPDAAIFRHKHNKKWFGLIMHVKNEEYLNVKTEPDYSDLLRSTHDYIIPAYHMNIVSRDIDKSLLFELIDQSFDLTKK